MTIKKNTIMKSLILILLCIATSACGGSKKSPDTTNVVKGSDITRPPVVVKNNRAIEAEKDPEETISFDEWKRQRDAEAANTDTP